MGQWQNAFHDGMVIKMGKRNVKKDERGFNAPEARCRLHLRVDLLPHRLRGVVCVPVPAPGAYTRVRARVWSWSWSGDCGCLG